MKNYSFDSTKTPSLARFLWFLTFSYAMLIIMAGWFNLHTLCLFSFHLSAGAFIFPPAFLLLSLITEIYGYKHARSAIWCGFLLNLAFIVYGAAVVHMPGPDYAKNNPAFDMLLTFTPKLFAASCVSYFTSAFLVSFFIAKSKTLLHDHYLGMRFTLSTIIAISAGSALFHWIIFFEGKSNRSFIALIFITTLLTLAAFSLIVYLTKKIKQLEGLDIHDRKTSFNLCSFDGKHALQDNKVSNPRE